MTKTTNTTYGGNRRAIDLLVADNAAGIDAAVTDYLASPARTKAQSIFDADDCRQEAVLGLIRAGEKFDTAKTQQDFGSYSAVAMRRAITRADRVSGRPLRLQHHLYDRHATIAKATKHLEAKLGRAPDDQELTHHTGLSRSQIEAVRMAFATIAGIVSTEEAREEVNSIPSAPRSPSRAAIEKAVHHALNSLPHRHRTIVELRYGLGDLAEPQSLQTVAERYGLSRQAIHQTEQRALNMLSKHPSIRTIVAEQDA